MGWGMCDYENGEVGEDAMGGFWEKTGEEIRGQTCKTQWNKVRVIVIP